MSLHNRALGRQVLPWPQKLEPFPHWLRWFSSYKPGLMSSGISEPALFDDTGVPQTESRTATFSDSPSSTTGSCGSQHGKKHFAPWALAATARCMNGNVSHKSKSKPPSNVCMWSKFEGYYLYMYIYIYIVCLFIYLLILYIIIYIYIYLSSKLSLEHLLLASMVWHLCFSKKPYAQRPQAKKPTISSVYYPC